MSLLSQADREYILSQLKLAPDHILADAMLAFNAVRDKMVGVRKLMDTALVGVPDVVIPAPTSRPNVDPGKPSIGKIGAEAKQSILGGLGNNGIQPPAKYTEHCKLLWSRGEIRFDGESWYV